MLKRVTFSRMASRLAFATLATSLGSAVCVLGADVGLVRASAASPGPALGSIAGGVYHACAVRSDGTLACWGLDTNGQSTPPAGTFTQVAAGGSHTCGVKTNGTLACWGWNNDGQSTPPAGTFTQVAGGYVHTCGRKTDGTFACWGYNSNGQSSPPTGTFSRRPRIAGKAMPGRDAQPPCVIDVP